MKPTIEHQMKADIAFGAIRITSKAELNAPYNGDPGGAADREFGVELPKMGRPKAGTKRVVTVAKTVKHTDAFWKRMTKKAKSRGLTLHEAMRDALAKWVTAE